MELNYKTFGTGYPVIILHGLLGSLDNWQSIAKKLAGKYEVYIIDQRNHGRSPQTDEFSYELLSNDLLDFFEQHQIAKAHMIGHSMGGKTAMTFAVEHPDRVDKLVVVDIAPAAYGDHHSNVFNAMNMADVQHANTRQEVEAVLRHKLNNDETTVQFLLKSLVRDKEGKHFEWRFNVESLVRNYPKIMEPVYSVHPFTGDALFIKGEHSNYISVSNYPEINELFPHHQIAEIKGAGHWVHADKPAEFVSEVMKFLG
jgi:esterase